MAVNFASAPTAIHNPMNRYNPYNGLSGPTPYFSNSNTPSTVSPTSPQISSASPSPGKHPAIARQIKPPKNPLYVPAVLRPTEAPSRHRSRKSSTTSLQRIIATTSSTPITPPSSAENSFDSKDGQRNMEETIQRRLLAGEGISRVVTDEWNDDVMEDVTGAPTRDHWKVCQSILRDPSQLQRALTRPLRSARDSLRLAGCIRSLAFYAMEISHGSSTYPHPKARLYCGDTDYVSTA